MRKAVLLDRDGVLNPERSFLTCPEQWSPVPGLLEALTDLRRGGFLLLVVTNQSGLARGLMAWEDLQAVHAHMLETCEGLLDAVYVCPHHPEEGRGPMTRACACRKPGDALVRQALAEWDFDPRRSFLCGDRPRDLAAGTRLGIRTCAILGTTPREDWPSGEDRPTAFARNLPEAAAWILHRA